MDQEPLARLPLPSPHLARTFIHYETSPSCIPPAVAVEAALQAVPGVQSAAVSLAVQQAEVRYNAGTVAGAGSSSLPIEHQLVAAVEDCGFEASGKRAG